MNGRILVFEFSGRYGIWLFGMERGLECCADARRGKTLKCAEQRREAESSAERRREAERS